VYKKQARPAFPLGVPQLYADMAKECWDQEPGKRPNFAALLVRLQVGAGRWRCWQRCSDAGQRCSWGGCQARLSARPPRQRAPRRHPRRAAHACLPPATPPCQDVLAVFQSGSYAPAAAGVPAAGSAGGGSSGEVGGEEAAAVAAAAAAAEGQEEAVDGAAAANGQH
jgi:hypothetical protein